MWSGAASEVLIRMTASLSGAVVEHRFQTYRPHEAFTAGPFTITPYLTDHSAFDAHMLLVDVGGKRTCTRATYGASDARQPSSIGS